MLSKTLFIFLTLLSSLAQAQTIYRTVSDAGKVIYSDTPQPKASNSSGQNRTYSTESLAGANAIKGSGGNALNACQPETRKFCAQASGDSARFECLLDHQQDVSDNCYDALKTQIKGEGSAPASTSTEPPKGPGQACRQDVLELCKGTQPGEGRIIKCLLDHQNELSDACYNELAKKMRSGNKPGQGGPGNPR